MKEFEKWWAGITANYLSDSEVTQDGHIAKVAWIAALKWIERINDSEAYNNVDQSIYEELKDGNP